MADRNPPNPPLTAKQAELARIDAAIADAKANVQLANVRLSDSCIRYDNAPAGNHKQELFNAITSDKTRLAMFHQDRRRAEVGKHIFPVSLIEPFCQERLDMFYQDQRGAAVGKHFFPGWSN